MYHVGFNLSTQTRNNEDNSATIAVSNNERATKRLRHVDLIHFAVLYWIKNGNMVLKSILTSDNPSEYLTKPLGSILHSRHSDYLLRKQPPSCCNF